MSKQLDPYVKALTFLSTVDEEIIRFIELQLNFASELREYQLKYNVSNQKFAREFGCPISFVPLYRKGAIDISLKEIAKLTTLRSEKISYKMQRIKVTGCE